MTFPRPRDRSRRFDVVVFGATGFTGALVAEYLVRRYLDPDLDIADGDRPRVALAGRSLSKLERLRRELAGWVPSAAELPLRVVDSFDQEGLRALAAEAEVVLTTVGPYDKYGDALVEACVSKGTDYVDLTGETPFIKRQIDRHQARAVETGARIVHCCGYDSIPSDLGTLMMQEAMRDRHDGVLDEVVMYAGESKGAVSGGTAASALRIAERAAEDRDVRRTLARPYSLYPEGEPPGRDGSDDLSVRFDDRIGMWTGPFVMANVNTRVVRRSNALLDFRYGRDFRYAERMSFGKRPKSFVMASAVAAGIGGFLLGASFGPTRRLLKRILPEPGAGPDRDAREAGYFVSRFVGMGTTADGRQLTLRGEVRGQQDPGYGETAKMISESALCLAMQGQDLEATGGIRTPASTMGMTLVERLRAQGMTFDVAS